MKQNAMRRVGAAAGVAAMTWLTAACGGPSTGELGDDLNAVEGVMGASAYVDHPGSPFNNVGAVYVYLEEGGRAEHAAAISDCIRLSAEVFGGHTSSFSITFTVGDPGEGSVIEHNVPDFRAIIDEDLGLTVGHLSSRYTRYTAGGDDAALVLEALGASG